MAHDIFLIAPADADAPSLAKILAQALNTLPASAILLTAGDRSDSDYGDWVRALAPIAQKADCAVILDNRPDLVKALDADGVHMSGGIQALREAVGALKPGYIVGTGDIGSRHEAMVRGELDIDYLMFGDRNEPPQESAEMADWWAETFEIPSIYVPQDPNDPYLAEIKTEFIGLTARLWTDPDTMKKVSELVQ